MEKKKEKPSTTGCFILVVIIIIAIVASFIFKDRNSDSSKESNKNSSSTMTNVESPVIEPKSKEEKMAEYIDGCRWDISTYTTNMELLRKQDVEANVIPSIRTQLSDIVAFYQKLNSQDTLKIIFAKEIPKYKSNLINTQKIIFPKMRKAFAENAKKKLWEEDVKVKYSGTTITFIGYQYTANRNIKESYEAIADALKQLRFKRVNFKWSEHAEYTYYTIDSPQDSEIIF